jgi:hypothetical protein
MSPLPQETEAHVIEFKNLGSTAVGQLEDGGADRATLARVQEQLDDLLDDGDFWSRLATSLAVFVTPDGMRTFRLPNRLSSMVEVSDPSMSNRCGAR